MPLLRTFGIDARRFVATAAAPELALETLEDAHVDPQRARRLRDEAEKGNRLGKEVAQRVLVDVVGEDGVAEDGGEREEVAPLSGGC